MKTETNIPYMKTLSLCLRQLKHEGFEDDFKVKEDANELTSLTTGQSYTPEQISVKNFFRFEGASNPDDNAILYALETEDGSKGTLIDAYGVYADNEVGSFMLKVESIQKHITR